MAHGGAAAAVVVVLILHVMSPILCQMFESDLLEDEDCLYETKEACNRADLLGCVWCALPRRCYSASRSLELGAFCNPSPSKERMTVATCDGIETEAKCSVRKGCRWCRSEELDDRCFGAREALRLPAQIFDCPKSSSHPLDSSLRRR